MALSRQKTQVVSRVTLKHMIAKKRLAISGLGVVPGTVSRFEFLFIQSKSYMKVFCFKAASENLVWGCIGFAIWNLYSFWNVPQAPLYGNF